MRAVICHEFGTPDSLIVEHVPEPDPLAGEVLLKVLACSVSFPDVLKIADKYQIRAILPFIPGSDVVGTVTKLGNGGSSIPVGAKVIASTQFGGLAEYVAVNQTSCIPIPRETDAIKVAGMAYAYGTSLYALVNRGQLQAGEYLVILGAAGGIGLAAVELGAQMGAHVIAAASSDNRLDACRERGAYATINYRVEDLRSRISELTSGRGVDVVYDAVGGPYAEPALRSMAWNGRYLVVGFASGEIPALRMNLPLLKGCQVIGVFWGEFKERELVQHRAIVMRLLEMLNTGTIKPRISGVFPLEHSVQALKQLTERHAIGKVVVVP